MAEENEVKMDKSRHLTGAQISKNKEKLYKQAFADLPEHTLYWIQQDSGPAVNRGISKRISSMQTRRYLSSSMRCSAKDSASRRV